MNYRKHYDSLAYFEKHHIIPKCLGGLNSTDNIVKLTPREHFVAHQLLVKIYPESKRLVYAAFLMTKSSSKHNRVNNRLYGWLKESLSISIRGQNNPMYGRTHTLEARKKISEATKGRRLCGERNVNCKISKEQVLKIRELYRLDSSKYSQKALSDLFGVKQAAISKIITKRTWKHVV